jgi:hypothetical protein
MPTGAMPVCLSVCLPVCDGPAHHLPAKGVAEVDAGVLKANALDGGAEEALGKDGDDTDVYEQ